MTRSFSTTITRGGGAGVPTSTPTPTFAAAAIPAMAITHTALPIAAFVRCILMFLFPPYPYSIRVERPAPRHKKTGMPTLRIVRHPGCLLETQWAFRPTLADGLVLSI